MLCLVEKGKVTFLEYAGEKDWCADPGDTTKYGEKADLN